MLHPCPLKGNHSFGQHQINLSFCLAFDLNKHRGDLKKINALMLSNGFPLRGQGLEHPLIKMNLKIITPPLSPEGKP